jgi:hypothetical protein
MSNRYTKVKHRQLKAKRLLLPLYSITGIIVVVTGGVGSKLKRTSAPGWYKCTSSFKSHLIMLARSTNKQNICIEINT